MHSQVIWHQLADLCLNVQAHCNTKQAHVVSKSSHNSTSATYFNKSIKTGNVVERVPAVAKIGEIGDPHVVGTRNKHQKSQHYQRP